MPRLCDVKICRDFAQKELRTFPGQDDDQVVLFCQPEVNAWFLLHASPITADAALQEFRSLP